MTSKSQGLAVGIDLGTTNSLVAVCHENGDVVVIPNSLTGDRTTPSYVAFDETERCVGSFAKTSAAQNPLNTVFEIKRILGRNYDDPEVARNIKKWPFKLENVNNSPVILVEELKLLKKYTPTEISAMVLASLKAYATQHLGHPVTKAVISVPAKFNDAQRKATREAGRLADLDVIEMINEPTAAAIGYKAAATANKTFLVFDFGGGTLDVSVVRCDENLQFKVLATEGDMILGGADFDDRLLNYYVSNFGEKHGINLMDHPTGLAQLRLQCEFVKECLSGTMSARATVACIANNVNFKEQMTRQKFEELCDDLFLRILEPVKNALRVAGLKKDQLDFVLLVGGSIRIPKVQKVLTEFFGPKVPLKFDTSPDETIAMGAAVYAHSLVNQRVGEIQKLKIADITPFTLGVEVEEGKVEPLIAKGSSVPLQVLKIFRPRVAGQVAASIKIYQGEGKTIQENSFLAELKLCEVTLSNDGSLIKVLFNFDRSGLLTVTASDYDNEALTQTVTLFS